MFHTTRIPKTRCVSALARLALASLLLAIVAMASAVPNPNPTPFTSAGSLIESQASASFQDSAGVTRETLSNVVITVVQKVVKVAVTGTPDRAGVPGATVELPFIVTNQGNDLDTITVAASEQSDVLTTTLQHDENCSGRVDAGEDAVSEVILARDERACLVISVAIAANATPADDIQVTLTAGSSGTTVESGDDSASATGTVDVVDQPVLTLFASATPTRDVAQGDTVTVRYDVTNTGSAAACSAPQSASVPAAGIFLAITIPQGDAAGENLTVASVDATSGAGTVTYYDDSGSGWTSSAKDEIDTASEKIGILVSGDGCFFPQGASVGVDFTLTVPSASPASGGPASGDAYETTSTITWKATADVSASDVQTTTANTLNHVVTITADTAIDEVDGTNVRSSDPDVNDADVAAENDGSYVVTSAKSGTVLTFLDKVTNRGNASDRFALSVTTAPTGWTCRVYQADELTPIVESVGPLDPGSARAFATRCSIPSNATGSDHDVVITATSTNDDTVTATRTWTVGSVASGFGVTQTVAPATAVEAAPGEDAAFLLTVANGGSSPDTFELGVTNVDAAFTAADVRFHVATCDGGTGQTRGAVVRYTAIIAPAASACYLAVVPIPSSATSSEENSGNRSVTFQVTSTTLNTATDSDQVEIDVDHVGGFTFTPNRSATVTSPGIVTVAHTLRNTGNTAGTASLAAATASPAGSVLFSTSENGTYTTTLSSIALAANGGETTVYVRLIAPSGQPAGRRIDVPINATLDYGGNLSDLARSVANTYDVIDGALRLTLAVDGCGTSSDCSGTITSDATQVNPQAYLRYTIIATNLGSSDVSQVIVTEPLPTFTDFTSASATVDGFTGTPQYRVGDGDWSQTAPGSMDSGQSLQVRIRSDDADVAIPPAGSVTVVIIVQVQ